MENWEIAQLKKEIERLNEQLILLSKEIEFINSILGSFLASTENLNKMYKSNTKIKYIWLLEEEEAEDV